MVGELLACYFRGGVDRGTILADEKDGKAGTMKHPDKVLGFTSSRAIAYGHRLDFVLVQESLQDVQRLHALATGRMGEDGLVVQEIALLVEAHHLATCAEPWVDAHDALLSERCGKEKLAQVGGKHADGLLICKFL